tara:strand:- start:278 stop:568 length:291 start_codon:yes stop_codon:yes gene_type:complete
MKNHASPLIDAIGPELLKKKIGLTARNIRHIRQIGKFPSKQYASVKFLGESIGVHVPMSAFSFEAPAIKLGNAKASKQGKEILTQDLVPASAGATT